MIQGAAMRCVEMVQLSGVPQKQWGVIRGSKHWCIAPNDPYLRLKRIRVSESTCLRNDLLRFQGRTIASETIVAKGKTIRTSAHIEKLETLPHSTDAIFRLPTEAVPAKNQEPVVMAGEMNWPILVNREGPVYPEAAKMSRITGTVVLQGEIDDQGMLTGLHAVLGPAALVPASLNAVRQWRFIPLIVNGKPVPVRARVNVVFQLR